MIQFLNLTQNKTKQPWKNWFELKTKQYNLNLKDFGVLAC